MDEEETNGDEEVNELYRDVNVNLEGRDTKMTYAPCTIIQTTQVIEDTHVIITLVNPKGQQQSSSVSSGFVSNMLNPSLDTGIDSIFNLNNESTSLVDSLFTAIAEIPLSSTITLPPPPIPLITHFQQTPVPTPATVPSSSLQDLPNFGSLFSSFFNSWHCDTYLANKMNEAVKTAVQLQSNRLRDEAQAKNEDFINKLDDNIKKIIKEQVKEQVKGQVSKILLKIEKTVNEQLEAEVLNRSSNESKKSQVVAANLSELELKKILIDKMERNKSIHRSDEQKNLYKALVDAYKSDKIILDTYGDTRRRAGKEPESTSALKEKTSKSTGKSKEGSKSHHTSIGKSAQAEEPIHADKDLKEPAHQEFDTGFTKDQHVDETTQHPDCNLARKEDTHDSFNELINTPLDFLAFMMNRLKVDTLTPELLAGPTFELMKGSCKSLVELEYFLEDVYKATTNKLDWNNPEGEQYPHDLRKPLPLIPNSQGHRVIPFDHFINNDLAYLRGRSSSRTYATSVTKTKAADYGHVKWIEDLVPNTMWSHVPVIYDKHALWGISHWGRKRQQFYGFAINRESTLRRNDDKLYKFKEGDYKRLRLQYIEDMLLLLVQGKLTNLTIEECLALNVSLRMFTRSIVIQRRVEGLQLAYPNPRCFIYQNKDKKNKLMRIDKLYKFSNGTLNDVQTALDDILKRIRMKYLPHTYCKNVDKNRAGAMIQAIDKQIKNRRIMRSLEKFVGGRPYERDFRLLQRTI
ncbi:hypothetical protein Tco_0715695 [Tanacetum coccineum]